MGWLRSLWRGEFTVAVAFWWYGFVMWLVSTTVIGLLSTFLWFNGRRAAAEWLDSTFMTAWDLYSIPLVVGIWRSTRRSRGGQEKENVEPSDDRATERISP